MSAPEVTEQVCHAHAAGSAGSAFSYPAPGSARLPASPLSEQMVATASLDTTPVAPIAHVLLCADDTLRLYPADGLKQGDRCALWHLCSSQVEMTLTLSACT